VVVPDLPSLVAVMRDVPVRIAVTSPFELIVATVVVPDDQVTVRPVSTLPAASLIVAVI